MGWIFGRRDYPGQTVEEFVWAGLRETRKRVERTAMVGAARRAAREEGEKTVRRIVALPIRRKAIENPRGTLVSRGVLPKPTQTIQPHQFGDDASKATDLWLWGLPPLIGTAFVKPRLVCGNCGRHAPYDAAFGGGCPSCGAEAGFLRPRWANQTDAGQNRLSPGPNRWKDRARTYPGPAAAMAAQWTGGSDEAAS